MQVIETHRIDWWGYGIETNVLMDHEEYKKIPEIIELSEDNIKYDSGWPSSLLFQVLTERPHPEKL